MLKLKAKLVEELPRLRRFAHGLTGNKPDADDLVQSLVEKLLNKQPDETPEVPWLLKVCKNLWVDKIRTETNRAHITTTKPTTITTTAATRATGSRC